MKKGWVGAREFKKKFSGEDFLEIQATRGFRDYWLDGQWPPVKVRILTEEEFQYLIKFLVSGRLDDPLPGRYFGVDIKTIRDLKEKLEQDKGLP